MGHNYARDIVRKRKRRRKKMAKQLAKLGLPVKRLRTRHASAT